ncbi:MAG: S8 family serine peptidase [Pseudomonadota bacterium]
MKRLFTASAVLLLVACGASDPFTGSASSKADAPTAVKDKPRVVVAVLDTGINPYHSFLYQGSPIYPDAAPSAVTPEVLAEFGIDAKHIIEVQRTGNYGADFLRDREMWMAVERGVPYWIKNTNIIVASFIEPGPSRIPVLAEGSTHGVGTSGSVLTANPEAIVFFIEQGDDGIGSPETHTYAFTHPAVDMMSTSYGVSEALGLLPAVEYGAFNETFTGVVELGKMHFSSGGNGPGLTNFRAGAGPWWSIGVSGFEEGSNNGRTILSGNFPDFIADFTQELPYCLSCEDGYEFVGGTSFSTPRSAGVASKILLEVRRALGHKGGIIVRDGAAPVMAEGKGQSITNWQIRRALEEAAYIPTATEFDPAALVDEAVGLGLSFGLPINPAAPWLQTGWGEISADPAKNVVSGALAFLGFGDGAVPAKPMGYCEFNSTIMQERHFWFSTFSPTVHPVSEQIYGPLAPVDEASGGEVRNYSGQQAGRTVDVSPYIYCASAVPAP